MTAAEKIRNNISVMGAVELADAVIIRQITFEDIRNAFGAEGNSKLAEVQNCLNSRMENRWRTVKLLNTVEDYQDYQAVFPLHLHKGELVRLMNNAGHRAADETAWRNLDLDDIDSLSNFLKSYPESGHADEAAALLQELETNLPKDEKCWIEIDKNDYDKIVEFLEKYPNSSKLEEAQNEKKRIEDSWDESERAWRTLNKNDRDSLIKYLDKYPASRYIEEIRDIIEKLEARNSIIDDEYFLNLIEECDNDDERIANRLTELIRERIITRDNICGFISRNPNVLYPETISRLYNKYLILEKRLVELGIDQRFIDTAKRISVQRTKFEAASPITEISKVCTEIYFWGLPSSGKSCAIGAILSIAGNGRIAKAMDREECQGYEYMSKLVSSFTGTNEVVVLPPSTDVIDTYELAFSLYDNKGYTHPITIIDLAGELVRCFYLVKAKVSLDEDHQYAWDTLQRLLVSKRSQNRKIHFFVIEYGAENHKYEGITSSIYLGEVAQSIKEMGLFKHDTDAIYVMVTKVDKIGKKGYELEQELRSYLNDKFNGFCNTLSLVCKENNINGGKLACIPFSLGQVCFSDLCIFNEKPASNVVKTLLVRSAGLSNNAITKQLQK